MVALLLVALTSAPQVGVIGASGRGCAPFSPPCH